MTQWTGRHVSSNAWGRCSSRDHLQHCSNHCVYLPLIALPKHFEFSLALHFSGILSLQLHINWSNLVKTVIFFSILNRILWKRPHRLFTASGRQILDCLRRKRFFKKIKHRKLSVPIELISFRKHSFFSINKTPNKLLMQFFCLLFFSGDTNFSLWMESKGSLLSVLLQYRHKTQAVQ